jgi:hypothetical protein
LLPGPDVQIIDAFAGSGGVVGTDTGFMVGLADRGVVTGPLTPADAVSSVAEWEAKFGAQQSYNATEHTAVEAFFAESGGGRLYYSRYAGPAAAKAQASVPTVTPKFTAVAKSVGGWANAVTVTVASGVITVREGTTVVETSPVLADVTAAQAWATGSRYIDITPVGTGALTDSAAVTLAGGADDRTNATDTQKQAALDRFAKALGPGQVSMPGDTRTQAHTMLATHALAYNRFAYGDMPDTPTVGTLTTAAAAVRALGRDLARHIQLLAPWVTAPGSAPLTTRSVPPSAVQSGMAARNDAATGNPNRAIAGPNGISRFATGVKQTYTDTDRSTLADAGVNVIVAGDGGIQTYDDVTAVDPLLEPEWLGAANNREVMALVDDLFAAAAARMFDQNDGPVSLDSWHGDLTAVCIRHKLRGSLFGDIADAFRVETGPPYNTPATAQAKKLGGAVAVKVSPSNRQVTIQFTNTPLTSAL